jgi:hypothetical protein
VKLLIVNFNTNRRGEKGIVPALAVASDHFSAPFLKVYALMGVFKINDRFLH